MGQLVGEFQGLGRVNHSLGPEFLLTKGPMVTIVDTDGVPVKGATVSGHWSGAASDGDSGVTGADGKVSLESDRVKDPPGGTIFTFTAEDVVLSRWTYDSESNLETSDSITVL